ncbi:MAG: hypothetical protein H5U07_09345 [Candidatus Aminicenantes bacterium]|nr:hypothetical protein [Candidatus Aminicenantes bacterium]
MATGLRCGKASYPGWHGKVGDSITLLKNGAPSQVRKNNLASSLIKDKE